MRNADDTTGAVRSAREAIIDTTTIDATTIDTTTIDAATPTGDRDATDATDATTSLSA